MSAEQTPDIERVLAEHAWAGTHGPSTDEHPLGRLSQCRCGWTDDYDLDPFGPWRAHVAQALAPVLAAAVREARAAALREAALSVPMGPTPDPADYLNACADRIAVDEPEHLPECRRFADGHWECPRDHDSVDAPEGGASRG